MLLKLFASRTNFVVQGKKAEMPATKLRDVTFLQLRDSILCSDCELISYNNTAQCLACGSTAVLSLSRVLGGSLRGEQCARVVKQRPTNVIEMAHRPAVNDGLVQPASGFAGKSALAAEVAGTTPFDSAMKMVVERGYLLSRSGGAAIAANRRGRMVCEARMGAQSPAIGTEVRGGLSSLAVQSARTLRCDLTVDDTRVDPDTCLELGIQSMVAAPVTNMGRVLGLITVVSPQPYAFDDRDVAVAQWLAGIMTVIFTGAAADPDLSFIAQSTTRAELAGNM
jgi:hypothetical protein